MPTEYRLTPKQAQFAGEYLADHNATQAAIRSGYSERTAKQQGSRLLTNVDVRAEIVVLEREQQQADQVDRQYVITRLRHFAEHGEKEANRLRATELLGKTVGLFVEQVEAHVTHNVQALREFTPDQLRAMLAEAKRQTAIEADGRLVG